MADVLPPAPERVLGDRGFDAMLPPALRALASVHFTPADVARRAAELLVVEPGVRVLDVGSAVGKFCVIAGIATPHAHFVGIERRRHLVKIATGIADRLELTNVSFAHGDAIEVDWSGFDGFYLFNPFAEHLREHTPVLDERIDLDPSHFAFYVRWVEDRLAAAPTGTRVVTYHGFSRGPLPGYVLTANEEIGTERLELWIKPASTTRPRRPGVGCRARPIVSPRR